MTDHPSSRHLVAGYYVLLATVCLIALGLSLTLAYIVYQAERHPAELIAPESPRPK